MTWLVIHKFMMLRNKYSCNIYNKCFLRFLSGFWYPPSRLLILRKSGHPGPYYDHLVDLFFNFQKWFPKNRENTLFLPSTYRLFTISSTNSLDHLHIFLIVGWLFLSFRPFSFFGTFLIISWKYPRFCCCIPRLLEFWEYINVPILVLIHRVK